MDLLNGLIAANAPIGKQDAVGSYITGVKSGEDISKQRIENENALYQQNLTLRLQKAIQESIKENGDLDYNALARNGKANGISPQTIDYMTKQLPAQWQSLANTAQSKMMLGSMSPSGYQQEQQNANTTSWSNQPAKSSQSNTQSSTKAPAVPVESSVVNDGDTSKNYTYLLGRDEKYTSNNPIKLSDSGRVVNAGSQADLEDDKSGFVTPDMLQSNQTTTGASNVNEGTNQVNIGASTLNPNAIISDALTPDTSIDSAPTDKDIKNTYEPSTSSESQSGSTGGFYDIGNKMNVINPSQMIGNVNGAGGNTNGQYFQVTDDTTKEALNAIRTNLERNANLPKNASRDVINQYLRTQQDRDYAAVGPAPILLPNAEGRFDYNDYAKRLQEWQKNLSKVSADWSEKYGKEYADQLTQQISKDANDRAELQLKNDATKYNNDINGRNDYAKQISATIGLGGTLNAATFGSIKEEQDFAERASAYKKLLGKAPTTALETLGWAKNFIQAEGLGEAEGTMKLVQLLATKDPAVRTEIELTYGGDVKSIGLQAAAHFVGKFNGGSLSDLRNEMKFIDDWRTHTGGKGLSPIDGTAPDLTEGEMDKPKPGDNTTTTNSIVKSGWYNNPAKATSNTFQTDNGNIYKVVSRGPVSGLPKTVVDDNGTVYNISDRNPADPNSKVDLIQQEAGSTNTPWTKQKAISRGSKSNTDKHGRPML